MHERSGEREPQGVEDRGVRKDYRILKLCVVTLGQIWKLYEYEQPIVVL